MSPILVTNLFDPINRTNGIEVKDQDVGSESYDYFMRVKNARAGKTGTSRMAIDMERKLIILLALFLFGSVLRITGADNKGYDADKQLYGVKTSYYYKVKVNYT